MAWEWLFRGHFGVTVSCVAGESVLVIQASLPISVGCVLVFMSVLWVVFWFDSEQLPGLRRSPRVVAQCCLGDVCLGNWCLIQLKT